MPAFVGLERTCFVFLRFVVIASPSEKQDTECGASRPNVRPEAHRKAHAGEPLKDSRFRRQISAHQGGNFHAAPARKPRTPLPATNKDSCGRAEDHFAAKTRSGALSPPLMRFNNARAVSTDACQGRTPPTFPFSR